MSAPLNAAPKQRAGLATGVAVPKAGQSKPSAASSSVAAQRGAVPAGVPALPLASASKELLLEVIVGALPELPEPAPPLPPGKPAAGGPPAEGPQLPKPAVQLLAEHVLRPSAPATSEVAAARPEAAARQDPAVQKNAAVQKDAAARPDALRLDVGRAETAARPGVADEARYGEAREVAHHLVSRELGQPHTGGPRGDSQALDLQRLLALHVGTKAPFASALADLRGTGRAERKSGVKRASTVEREPLRVNRARVRGYTVVVALVGLFVLLLFARACS
jgi:hypothetical protein